MKNKRLLIVFLSLVVIIVIAEFTGLRSIVTIPYIKSLFVKNILLSSISFILFFTLANIIQIPGWPFLVASILTLGTLPGYLLTLTAAMFSTIAGFLLIRYIGKNSLQNLTSPIVTKLIKRTHSSPVKSTVILRVIFQTAPPINYALALSGIHFKHYLLGSIIGLPIPIYIYTFFIDELSRLTF
jgi:uncharacterized membrane protein YdjX (TVP38/TMEM64 family)